MAISADKRELFQVEWERVRKAVNESKLINSYAVILRSRRPDLNAKEIYNTFHLGRGKNKWVILRMIGELVGVEVSRVQESENQVA
jgi:hypothetical protein